MNDGLFLVARVAADSLGETVDPLSASRCQAEHPHAGSPAGVQPLGHRGRPTQHGLKLGLTASTDNAEGKAALKAMLSLGLNVQATVRPTAPSPGAHVAVVVTSPHSSTSPREGHAIRGRRMSRAVRS